MEGSLLTGCQETIGRKGQPVAALRVFYTHQERNCSSWGMSSDSSQNGITRTASWQPESAEHRGIRS